MLMPAMIRGGGTKMSSVEVACVAAVLAGEHSAEELLPASKTARSL